MSKFKEERLQSGYDVLFESASEQIGRHFSGEISWEQLEHELLFLAEHHRAEITLRAGPDPWPLRFDGARFNVPPLVKFMVETRDGVRLYQRKGAA